MMSFLEKNLNALPLNQSNRNFVRQLRQHTLPAEAYDRLALEETPSGALTLYWDDKPDHHPYYPEAEAQMVVEQSANRARHALHVVLGLGLGYTLKALLAWAEEHQWQGDMLLLEEDVDLLYILLENIDFSSLFSYPRLRLFTRRSDLWSTSEGCYVEKDGVHYLANPQHVNRLGESTLSDIIQGHQHYLQNAKGNAYLLGLRGVEWAKAFFANLHRLPTLQPVDLMYNAFAGQNKTAVLCGGGPSLAKGIPFLKEHRDEVVIFAIGRSVRPLIEAGIQPDFVVFMDFIGPSIQLHGVDVEQLRHTHMITGISAEPMVFDVPFATQWVAALHANEQFTFLMDALYNHHLCRFNTGGSVSIFNFTIAYNLGFSHYVLMGQDLCLQDGKVYATDAPVEIKDGTIYTAGNETTFERVEQVLQRPGWDGTPRITKQDYIHFHYIWERLGQLAHKETRTGVSLINASEGGLYIKGWDHVPIHQLAERLTEARAKATATAPLQSVNRIVVEALEQGFHHCHPTQVYRTLLRESKNMEHVIERVVQQGKKAQRELSTLFATPFERWYKASTKYAEQFNAFSELLENHPLLQFTFYGQQKALYDKHNADASTEQEHRQNLRHDEAYLKTLLTDLHELQTQHVQPALKRVNTLELGELVNNVHPFVKAHTQDAQAYEGRPSQPAIERRTTWSHAKNPLLGELNDTASAAATRLNPPTRLDETTLPPPKVNVEGRAGRYLNNAVRLDAD